LGAKLSVKSPSDPNQQPTGRIVGRRKQRTGGVPTAADREALASMARYRTRAPKGVFIYYSAREMDRDRLRWTVDAVVERQR
jgi:hypothetical protein